MTTEVRSQKGGNGKANGHTDGAAARNNPIARISAKGDGAVLDRLTPIKKIPVGAASRDDQFAAFQSDAPSCDNCGAITVRSGNCYLCYNCGASMGCS
jgi:ribonucleoside-diphosphate reductase alpha chain